MRNRSRRGFAWWEVLVAVGAVLAAVAAVWVTLDADFLAYPAWLAAQKADFILGPVFVGLYWRRVRPGSRFGPLLIVFGAVGAVYILQSSSNPWLFGAGVFWEAAIFLGPLVLILTFPTGRLDGMAAIWTTKIWWRARSCICRCMSRAGCCRSVMATLFRAMGK